MIIRDAAAQDSEGIMRIYNDAVAHTTAIWSDIQVEATNRAAWLKDRQAAGCPVIVAVEGGEVIGYASFGDWRAWDGYRHTVEHSVYVSSERRGGGIGKALMTELIERARGLGKHVIVAGIEASNDASIALHERLGFERAGTLREVGTKFGRWLNPTFMQLVLTDPTNADHPQFQA